MSASATPSPDENALYYNLCLLGIPTHALKHGIELNRQSFRKPNPRGLELVLFYLYAAVCGETKANKEFRGMCPIPDKSQSKEFNQKVTDWFKELKEKHQLESIGSMTASQVRSATGHRAVSALLELSTLALLLEYQRLAPEAAKSWNFKNPPEKDPKFLPELAHVLPRLGAVAIKVQAQHFTTLMQKAAAAQEIYESCAHEFKDQFYHLRSQCQQLQYTLDPEDAKSLEVHIQAQALQPGALAPLPPLLGGSAEPSLAFQHASSTAARLEQHLEQYDALGGLMEDTIGSTVHPHAIDGAKLAALARAGKSAELLPDGTFPRPQLHEPTAAGSSGSSIGGPDLAATSPVGADVDVADMLEQWVSNLEQCCPLMEALAGQQGQGMCPLAAPAHDSSSHAALLGTQLKARKAAVDSLTTMKAALQAQHFSTDRLLQEMPARVAAAMTAYQKHSGSAPTSTPAAAPRPSTSHRSSETGLSGPRSGGTTPPARTSNPGTSSHAVGPLAVMGPVVHGQPPTPLVAEQQAKRGSRTSWAGAMGTWGSGAAASAMWGGGSNTGASTGISAGTNPSAGAGASAGPGAAAGFSRRISSSSGSGSGPGGLPYSPRTAPQAAHSPRAPTDARAAKSAGATSTGVSTTGTASYSPRAQRVSVPPTPGSPPAPGSPGSRSPFARQVAPASLSRPPSQRNRHVSGTAASGAAAATPSGAGHTLPGGLKGDASGGAENSEQQNGWPLPGWAGDPQGASAVPAVQSGAVQSGAQGQQGGQDHDLGLLNLEEDDGFGSGLDMRSGEVLQGSGKWSLGGGRERRVEGDEGTG